MMLTTVVLSAGCAFGSSVLKKDTLTTIALKTAGGALAGVGVHLAMEAVQKRINNRRAGQIAAGLVGAATVVAANVIVDKAAGKSNVISAAHRFGSGVAA